MKLYCWGKLMMHVKDVCRVYIEHRLCHCVNLSIVAPFVEV